MKKTCHNPNCMTTFIPTVSHQKYCSNKCRAQHGVFRWRKKNANLCKCGKPILPESTMCRTCFQHSKTSIIYTDTLEAVHEKLSAKGKHPSWKNAVVRNMARYHNQDLLKKPCERCGYTKHVELCHVKAISSFPNNTKLYEINNRKNLIVLCRNCHWEFDHKLFTTTDIQNPTRDSNPNSTV